jgi:hypothetical protein
MATAGQCAGVHVESVQPDPHGVQRGDDLDDGGDTGASAHAAQSDERFPDEVDSRFLVQGNMIDVISDPPALQDRDPGEVPEL